MHDIAEFLSRHELFGTLEPEETERLAERIEIEYFEAGATIFRQGAGPPDEMWVLRTGAVELLDDGRVLDLLGEGEPFGHPWMLSGMPTGWEGAPGRIRSATAPGGRRDPDARRPGGAASVARALMDRPRPGVSRPRGRTTSTSAKRGAAPWFASARSSASRRSPCARPPGGWRSTGSARSSSTW